MLEVNIVQLGQRELTDVLSELDSVAGRSVKHKLVSAQVV